MATLFDIFWFFLKAGAFSFGGPNSHIKLMHNELVTKKHLIGEEEFIKIKRLCNTLPGPPSMMLAMKIGYIRKGVLGQLAALIGFILPSSLLMLVIAIYYKEFVNDNFKIIDPFLYGMRTSVIAILLYTTLVYCIRYIRDFKLGAIFLVVAGAALAGLNIVLLLFLSGAAYVLLRQFSSVKKSSLMLILQAQPQFVLPVLDNQKIFWVFVKLGSLILGSGYFVFALIKMDLVDNGLFSINALLDTVAFSLFVPGSIMVAVTFVGYIISSWQGAALALGGALVPIFVYSLLSSTLLSRLISTASYKLFFRGVLVASLAVLLSIIFQLGYETIGDIRQWVLFILCMLIMFKWPKLNLLWIIIIGANLGYIILHFYPLAID
ncbi:MAG TPA: chromate efflux transporter [Saprospiraceae bacterium]|jgi:chromate transporter|nr:MAG: chromate ion transporter family chromate transporter [Candidatus Parvibacillus calidus]MBX2937348.1 chromate efflux transporter [Saprospiraceae bacterium]MBK7740801.1 chromate efflux transporter [Candidatus Parvibacillus calidus]MBX7178279.1 chromate efflux transporter [Saprospiraceae bacterium]MCB0590057.1 chromate efflux transporter [Saprospiraceae bacterium]